jgi:hypothetical protein
MMGFCFRLRLDPAEFVMIPDSWPSRRGLLTVSCSCGVVFERWVTPEEADADLLRLAALN